MDKLLFVIMGGIVIYVTAKNISLIMRYKHNKEYIECYQDVLHGRDNCYDRVKNYIAKEKLPEYQNKTRIIQLYYELENDLPYEDTLKAIDLKTLFYRNNKVDKTMINVNSDVFVFIMLTMAKAYEKKKMDVADQLTKMISDIDAISNRLEYHEIIAFNNALNKKEDCGSAFMHSLLEGTYTEYKYEKNMIGLYKRFASSTLALNNEEFEGFFKSDLHSFAKTLIGGKVLKSLGLYEAYKPLDEE